MVSESGWSGDDEDDEDDEDLGVVFPLTVCVTLDSPEMSPPTATWLFGSPPPAWQPTLESSVVVVMIPGPPSSDGLEEINDI